MKINNLFVCIGAQKAGTSWLSANLTKDKRFAKCPFIKEIHYFDYIHNNSPLLNRWRANFLLQLCQQGKKETLKPLLANWLNAKGLQLSKADKLILNDNKLLSRRINLLLNEANDDWYGQLLRTTEKQPVALDITPDYAVIGEQGFEHIKRVANNVKLLFILRDPVQRAWSGLLQGKKHTPEGIDGFLNRVTDEEQLIKVLTSGSDIGARNNYLATLEDLDAAGLLKERVLIKFYDEIAINPEKFISDIYQFINLPLPEMAIFNDTLHNRIHATPKTPMPLEVQQRVKAHYAPMLAEINRRFITVPNQWL
jgi:hypothetical protein